MSRRTDEHRDVPDAHPQASSRTPQRVMLKANVGHILKSVSHVDFYVNPKLLNPAARAIYRHSNATLNPTYITERSFITEDQFTVVVEGLVAWRVAHVHAQFKGRQSNVPVNFIPIGLRVPKLLAQMIMSIGIFAYRPLLPKVCPTLGNLNWSTYWNRIDTQMRQSLTAWTNALARRNVYSISSMTEEIEGSSFYTLSYKLYDWATDIPRQGRVPRNAVPVALRRALTAEEQQARAALGDNAQAVAEYEAGLFQPLPEQGPNPWIITPPDYYYLGELQEAVRILPVYDAPIKDVGLALISQCCPFSPRFQDFVLGEGWATQSCRSVLDLLTAALAETELLPR